MANDVTYHELSDENWVSKLMFFADLFEHPNNLSAKLQGSGKAVDVTCGSIMAFEYELDVSKRDMYSEIFRYYQNFKRHIDDPPKDNRSDRIHTKLILGNIASDVEQFVTRFFHFRELDVTAKFMLPVSMKMEGLNLQMF